MIPPLFHHFAPGRWINDPVGLHRQGDLWVLHDQRAAGVDDRAIGWGRATSRDLLTWRDEGIAIAPGPDGWIYSGCVVEGDGGDGGDRGPRAFFTLHDPSSALQAQASARWRGGWRRDPEPLIDGRADMRDPFVFRWDGEWRMLLAAPPPWDDPAARPSTLRLLRSADLAAWRELGPVGPSGEAVELFETPLLRRIPCEGEPAEAWPWLLAVGLVDRRAGRTVCGSRAWFGRFDGTRFEPVGDAFPLDRGPDFYAPALWSGTSEDEVVAIGWTNSWAYARRLPSVGWSGGAHALPRRLTARRRGGGWTLAQRPAASPRAREPRPLGPGAHRVGARASLGLTGCGALRLGDLTLRLGEGSVLLQRRCDDAGLRAAGFAGEWAAPRRAAAVEWLLDGCVAELFTGDGETWLSALTLRGEDDRLEIADDGLTVKMRPIA